MIQDLLISVLKQSLVTVIKYTIFKDQYEGHGQGAVKGFDITTEYISGEKQS